jgi:hypothetical protein
MITPSLVDRKFRRIRLICPGRKLEVFEHIGILRWVGLNAIVLSSDPWPPHFGNGLPLWEALRTHCQKDLSKTISWQTVVDPVKWVYPNLRGGKKGFTQIFPVNEQKLYLDVTFSYRPYGEITVNMVLPDELDKLEEVFKYPAQGTSAFLHKFLFRATSHFGWPKRSTITWPQDHSKEELMRRFVLHRVLDLLGGLSLLCGEGLFAGRVVSRYSGHQADIEAARKCRTIPVS